MNRVMKIQCRLFDEIDRYGQLVKERDASLMYEKIHALGSGKIGYILGLQRGLDPELASIVASLHDFGRIVTGKQKDHAEQGYEPVREFLRSTGLVSEEEVEIIAKATRNHSKKSQVGDPYDEIAKDADVLDFHQLGYDMQRQEQQDRLDKLLADGWSMGR